MSQHMYMYLHVSIIHWKYLPAKPVLFLDFACISLVIALIYHVCSCTIVLLHLHW